MSTTEFSLPVDAYLTFDALTLKQLLINRLKENSLFTDQDFEASNWSGFIDLISTFYHILLFQYNQNSSMSLFDSTVLDEVINRIVKPLNYKPLGAQTSLLGFNLSATSDLTISTYTIPRYSSISVDNIGFTFRNDITFEKATTSLEFISSVSRNVMLYQGIWKEFPIVVAQGEEFEVIPITFTNTNNTAEPRFVADNTIDVYVKDSDTLEWQQWFETETLFDALPTSLVYERRLNEYGSFELKFGNGVKGSKLKAGDEVAVYFILSDGKRGELSPGKLNGARLVLYNTSQYSEIADDVFRKTDTILPQQLQYLQFNNTQNSTLFKEKETVEEIRNYTPKIFTAQNRAVTVQDYETISNRLFSNITLSNKVVDNSTYIDEYIRYMYRDLNLDRPNDSQRVALNQANFASSCNFNNVYVFSVPRINTILSNSPTYLTTAQKSYIVDKLSKVKMMSHEIVPQDPVYTAVGIGIGSTATTLTPDVRLATRLVITRENNSNVSNERIKQDVYDAIISFFDPANVQLGQLIDLTTLNNSILSINGVASCMTTRNNVSVNGVSIVYWNILYPQDINATSQNVQLPFYKYPYLINPTFTKQQITIR